MNTSLQTAQAMMLTAPVSARDFTGARRERAYALFELMQDRHVPITPRLASALAVFETAPRPAEGSLWAKGYGPASAAVGMAGKLGNQPAWQDVFPAFLSAVVEPLLRTYSIGSNQLQIAVLAEAGDRRWPARAKRDGDVLEAWVLNALTNPDVMGQAFWRGAGVALLGAFRSRDMRRAAALGTARLPFQADLTLSELAFGIEPELEDDPAWRKTRVQPSARSRKLRAGTRPREGGMTGMLHSRRIRDIPDALPSVYALPKRIRLLKMIEEGFMIPHRPPYRRPDRDLLAMTMQTARTEALPSAQVAKAAWLDASLRLRIILANMSLSKSELVYTQARQTGLSVAAQSIADQQNRLQLDAFALKDNLRQSQIAQSLLLPGLFDEVAQVPFARDIADTPLRATLEMQTQAMTAGAVARMLEPGHRVDPANRRSATLDDYAGVLLLEIAAGFDRPGERIAPVWRRDRRELRARYGFDRGDALRMGMILCPETLTDGAVFTLCAGADETPQEIAVTQRDRSAGEALGAVIGALSGWIITQTIRAATHG